MRLQASLRLDGSETRPHTSFLLLVIPSRARNLLFLYCHESRFLTGLKPVPNDKP